MTNQEKAMALLCGDFGDGLRPLSIAEFNSLSDLVKNAQHPIEPDRELTLEDLWMIGYHNDPERVIGLLDRDFVDTIGASEVSYLTRLSSLYPRRLISALGEDAARVLYYYGDPTLFNEKKVSLVGMRDCSRKGLAFAARAGETAAKKGCVLVSGGANGADSAAENAALENGGRVISVLAASISARIGQNSSEQKRTKEYCEQGRLLLCCPQYPYSAFTSASALGRNKYIHAMSDSVFVSDCELYKGGTWSGTQQNIKYGWSEILVFDNGMDGNTELIKQGCKAVSIDAIGYLIN